MRKAPASTGKRTVSRRPRSTRIETPRYERDDGPLTEEQMEAIRRLQPPGRLKASKRLF